MSRIRKFYDLRFRRFASGTGVPERVGELFAEAVQLSQTQHLKPDMALGIIHADLRRSVGETNEFPQRFFCDVGLGGLARWLRGAGYESVWKPNLDDATVIRETQRLEATLITTDSLMMERGVLRDGNVPWVWVPSSLTCEEQLIIVLRELALPIREPRCMSCGGSLYQVDKEIVADRIPPRTALWLDEYFECGECHQIFWRGTHWKRITEELTRLRNVSLSLS
ncbi:MAG: hypothetical protein JWM68_2744 [Verrucomicrobiales bacterium]|nr:hypothetical protein [Verrucomicrobiales bacterium]